MRPLAPPALAAALLSLASVPAAATVVREVRLNEVQVIGSHNSYHVQPIPELIEFYVGFDPNAIFWEYTHRPLDEQFGLLGIRQIELDIVVDDPAGGRYAEPKGPLVYYGEVTHLPEHDVPGLKVIHVPDLDFTSTCTLFVECLAILRDWSDANPDHLPILVLVELKDDPPPISLLTQPLPFDAAAMDQIDAEIRSVFPAEQILTPDDVRGTRATLREALEKDGWPTLREARGKVLFAMDNGGGKRDLYVAGHPSLAGRVMFTDSPPGSPEAAFAKRNDPIGQFDDIQALVRDNYIVRTRADADTVEARTGDTAPRDAALASGAQFVSTDYPELGPFGTDYIVRLPGDASGICNPVDSPAFCRDDLLENLTGEGQGIAGRLLLVQDPAFFPRLRSLTVAGSDLAIATPLPGSPDDPSAAGATIRLANPATGESVEFALPPGRAWRAYGKDQSAGFVYSDPFLREGPCSWLKIGHGASLSARCSGLRGGFDFTLNEPSQGALDVTVQLGAAPEQCMRFGGTIDRDTPARRFKTGIFLARRAPAAGCAE
jgi:hypothetical protein